MKLEVKYIFPVSTPGVNNYICKLPEGLGMRSMGSLTLKLSIEFSESWKIILSNF